MCAFVGAAVEEERDEQPATPLQSCIFGLLLQRCKETTKNEEQNFPIKERTKEKENMPRSNFQKMQKTKEYAFVKKLYFLLFFLFLILC